MLEGLMSRWIMPWECRWARAVKRAWRTGRAEEAGRAEVERRVERGWGRKGRARMRFVLGPDCWVKAERRGMMWGALLEVRAVRRRASRWESCGAGRVESVVILRATRVLVLGSRARWMLEKRPSWWWVALV